MTIKSKVIIGGIISGTVCVIVILSYCAGKRSVLSMVVQDKTPETINQIEGSFRENYKPPKAGHEDDYINHLVDHLYHDGGVRPGTQDNQLR